MRVAVVGHVEWIEFVRVERVPSAGEIAHPTEHWEGPGGGGGVAAAHLAKLAGSCVLFTALGDDGLGHRVAEELRQRGVRAEVSWRSEPTRWAFVFIDGDGERTITTVGRRLEPSGNDDLPWDDLARFDAAYFTAGDVKALQAARQARVLVATTREIPMLSGANTPVDAVVGSGLDPAEAYHPGDLDPAATLAVATDGRAGGRYVTSAGVAGRFDAAEGPGPVVDRYGCGDAFAAGLTFGLAARLPAEEAMAFAARCGAAALTARGPSDGELPTLPA
jgi:ribokinase